MTGRQLEALKQFLLARVDDPGERQRLFVQALDADAAREDRRLRQRVVKEQRRIDYHERRLQRLAFLLDGVAVLMPEIPDPKNVLLGELIERAQAAHPELAEQLRAFVEGR
jgi:hypothetical protein